MLRNPRTLREEMNIIRKGTPVVDPFADAKPRLSRRGQEARLRVNPEQAPAFMPGTRGVDILRGLAVAGLTLFLASSASAESGKPSHAAADSSSSRALANAAFDPSSPLVLVPAAAAPVIDGKLDDAIWSGALKFDAFKTFKPDSGKDPSQRTEAYVSYDAENLYFAFRCYDTEAGKIKSSVSKRDSIMQDDVVAVILDMFNDKQSGLFLMLNPLGIQADGTMNVQGNVDVSYDAVWFSKGVIDDKGWTVEARIPLQSIRFPNKKTLTMRAFFLRWITRTSEQASYPPLDPNNSNILAQGQAIDVSGLHYHRVAELIPAVTYRGIREAQNGAMVQTEATKFKDVTSLTGKFGITSDLTMDGTYNPDFSQVEADAGQIDINLRYANFYPEKRPFFLEGQDLWQFGGMMEEAPLQALFYSRTIVDPAYGFRLTGKVSALDTVAAIYAKDNLPGDTVDVHPDFTIFRYKHAMNGDTYIGGFYTGRESGSVFNRVGGLDGRFRLGQPSVLSFHLFGSLTRRESGDPTNKDHALGIEYTYNTRKWVFDLGYQDISKDFQVDSGFVTRTGLRRLGAFIEYEIYPKSAFIQKIEPFYWGYQLYDTIYNMWETFNLFTARFYLPRSTQIRFDAVAADEVFAGQRFRRSGAGMQLQSQIVKRLYVQVFARWTGAIYYDPAAPYQGYGGRIQAGLDYQPTEKLDISLSVAFEDFRRSLDHTKIYDYTILHNRNTFQLNKYLFLRVIPEYNLYYKRLTVDTLASFTYIPGTVFYVGYGSAYERVEWNGADYIQANRFLQTKQGFFFKISYLWRF